MWDKKFGKQRIYVMPTKQGGILKYCLKVGSLTLKAQYTEPDRYATETSVKLISFYY